MANIINGTDTGSGGLITTGDSSDELQLQTAETARVTLTNTAVVVNEGGNDVDFRVESDTDANAFFVEGSSGNVGMGVTPSAWNSARKAFQIGAGGCLVGSSSGVAFSEVGANFYLNSSAADTYIGSDFASKYRQANSIHSWYIAPSGTAGNAITFTQAMTLDASGNLLVGTTSALTATNENGFYVTGGIIVSRQEAGLCAIFRRWSTNGDIVQFRNTANSGVGTITTSATATVYGTSSDYRLKENVAPMTGALAKVLELNPVTYTWKVDGSAGEGFIAHELQAVCPDAVTGVKDETEIQQVEVSPAVPATYDDEGNELTPAVEAVYEEREVPVYQGVDTSFLVATLTAAIQELSAKNDALEARIAALETGA